MSTPDERRLTLSLIEQVWSERPDERLGQILSNAARFQGKDLYYLTQQELADGLLDVKRSRKATPPPRNDPPQDPFPPTAQPFGDAFDQFTADMEERLTVLLEDPVKFFRNLFGR